MIYFVLMQTTCFIFQDLKNPFILIHENKILDKNIFAQAIGAISCVRGFSSENGSLSLFINKFN